VGHGSKTRDFSPGLPPAARLPPGLNITFGLRAAPGPISEPFVPDRENFTRAISYTSANRLTDQRGGVVVKQRRPNGTTDNPAATARRPSLDSSSFRTLVSRTLVEPARPRVERHNLAFHMQNCWFTRLTSVLQHEVGEASGEPEIRVGVGAAAYGRLWRNESSPRRCGTGEVQLQKAKGGSLERVTAKKSIEPARRPARCEPPRTFKQESQGDLPAGTIDALSPGQFACSVDHSRLFVPTVPGRKSR